jgi:phosphoglycerate dehydrogenase-like enzyme
MMDAPAFARMKNGAVFVTTARGGIHDEAALLDALTTGHLKGAGLDVWGKEPPPLDHPLLQRENVVVSYHTAGVTPEARRNMWALAAEQIICIFKGGRSLIAGLVSSLWRPLPCSHPGVTVLFAVDQSRRTIGSNGHRPSDVHNGLAG